MKPALLLLLTVGVLAGTDAPALFQSGRIPVLSVSSVEVGGGEVLLEVSVSRMGAVTAIKPLRETPTFTERMIQAVKTWTFSPAQTDIPESRRKSGGPTTESVESKVLVAGVFRRPAVVGATLGEPIKDVATGSADIPFPSSLVTPPHPPGAMNPGVVLVEVQIDAKGTVADAKVRLPAAGFDEAALSTARQWKFRPARPGGAATTAIAYIVFGFPVPRG